MDYGFFAFMGRMKYIMRWGLMRSVERENIAEHSQQTAVIAHALAMIDNRIFRKAVDADRTGMIAVYHETGEVITGDLPTPIKYYSEEISGAYKRVEAEAERKLLEQLPPELKGDISSLVCPDKDSYEYRLVKCADKLAAYIKCIEELRCNNGEFRSAYNTIGGDLERLKRDFPCVKYFCDNFLAAYYKTLDELS